jgi:flagellar biosynthesis/type III secretory pathway M-ring protein FliF/YscJ
MTIDLNGADIEAIAQVAAFVGSVVGMLVMAVVVYFLVRPPRHVRRRRKDEEARAAKGGMDPIEAEELWRVVDRMEMRLDVLERVLTDKEEFQAIAKDHHQDTDNQEIYAPAEDGRVSGRTK